MSLLLLMGDSAPSIGSLFASGEAGLALDVETAYRRGWIFQDSAGASVSAAAGDPVGLILDTAKGGLDSLGSDLVSNGTFATDTVWSKGANWTIGSGVATKTGGAANNLTQTITSTAGLWYRITMDVTRTAGELTVSLGTSGTTRVINASGSYTFFILAGSSTQTLTLAGDSSFAGTVDNVTARLVPGNHAYQTTSGSRPALARTPDGGRRNLLFDTESFGAIGWVKTDTTVTDNTVISPDGTTTADSLNGFGAGSLSRVVYRNISRAVPATFSVYAKKETNNFIQLLTDQANNGFVNFDLNNGTLSATTATGTITDVGNGWYRCSMAITSGSTFGNIYIGLVTSNSAARYEANTLTTTVYLWGAQLETGSSATAYQKVGLTSDVTESGKRDCWGLLFDGSDDSLQTASVDFSATDKMTVMTGVRKLSDAARGMLVELSASLGANTGTFLIAGPDFNLATDRWAAYIRGNGSNQSYVETSAAYAAPVTNVLTVTGDLSLSVSEAVLRIDSALRGSTTVGDSGGGNFGNYPIYIGSRAGSSIRLNGLIYTLIVRGAATPTSTIADFERNLLRLRAGLGPF